MFRAVLFIELLLVHYATQSHPKIQADCNKDVSLQCPGVHHMDFLSVAWYKLNENKGKSGIIRKRKDDTEILLFNFSREATFGDKHSLLLLNVTPADSGSYECAISAKVGGKNMNTQVDLIVHECVTQTELTTMANELNTTHLNPLPTCTQHVQDLPVMWSSIGYVAVALTKIVLSVISVWVIHRRSR